MQLPQLVLCGLPPNLGGIAFTTTLVEPCTCAFKALLCPGNVRLKWLLLQRKLPNLL
jgi:hypothetical protein